MGDKVREYRGEDGAEDRELSPLSGGLFSHLVLLSAVKRSNFNERSTVWCFPHSETANEYDCCYWKYLEVLKCVLSSVVLCLVILTRRGSEFQCIFRGLDQFALTLLPEFDDRSVQIWAAGCNGRCNWRWLDLQFWIWSLVAYIRKDLSFWKDILGNIK